MTNSILVWIVKLSPMRDCKSVFVIYFYGTLPKPQSPRGHGLILSEKSSAKSKFSTILGKSQDVTHHHHLSSWICWGEYLRMTSVFVLEESERMTGTESRESKVAGEEQRATAQPPPRRLVGWPLSFNHWLLLSPLPLPLPFSLSLSFFPAPSLPHSATR